MALPTTSSIHRSLAPPRCAATAPDGAGSIRRSVLSNRERLKLNTAPDREFYAPTSTIQLSDLYRQRIPPGSELLDLMSSWVSHLPPEIRYKRVVGHGLNAQELLKNDRLDDFFVKDLNRDPSLAEFAADESFDAVLCAVSVQEHPEAIFGEIFRVLRPGVAFSNRMFFDKAIAAWRDGSDYSRIQLVVQYFQAVAGFTKPEIVKKIPGTGDNLDDSILARLVNLWPGRGRDP